MSNASDGKASSEGGGATNSEGRFYLRVRAGANRLARRMRDVRRRFHVETLIGSLVAAVFIVVLRRDQVFQGLDWMWAMTDASGERLRIVAGFGVFLTALIAYRTYRRDQSWKCTQWAIDQLVDSYSSDATEDPAAGEVCRDAAVLGALYLMEAPRILAEDKDLLIDMFDQVLASAESAGSSNALQDEDVDEREPLEDNGMDDLGEEASGGGEERQQKP